MKHKHNWKKLAEKANKYIAQTGFPFSSRQALADFLEVPVSSVKDAFYRGDLNEKLVGFNPVEESDFPTDTPEVVYDGNTATAKFAGAERLTVEDMLELGGIDKGKYRISKVRENAWTMGRKGVVKSLEYVDGRVSGNINDSGGISKAYMWQMEVTLERIDRIAITPVMRPIELPYINTDRFTVKQNDFGGDSVLFWSDTHFGYNGARPVHARRFISALIWIAQEFLPRHNVHGGDVLDLPGEWSSFTAFPEEMRMTQNSAIEASYVFSQMRPYSDEFVVIEGNHDFRMRRALAKNMSEAYELKPVHDLDGYALMSIPRLLGFEQLDIQWYAEYERNPLYIIGDAGFAHGAKSSSGVAKTVASLGNRTVHTLFFGHIHDYELGLGYDRWTDSEYYIASPGSCCTRLAPGAKNDSNWTIGAFLIHLDSDGVVMNVEHIRQLPDGRIIFRGKLIEPESYVPGLNKAFNGTGYEF